MTDQEKQDLINYRIVRATETLAEVLLLADTEHWNAAVNRLYYACYYAVSALLVKHDVSTKTHDGLRRQFGALIIQQGMLDKDQGIFYSTLFNMRQKGDYDDFVIYNQEQVEFLIPKGVAFLERIKELVA